MQGSTGVGGEPGGGSGSRTLCWPCPRRYDRQKLTLKDVHNCQYVACMNPTAGSFTIDPRLQVGRTWTHLGQLQEPKARFGK